MKIKKHHKSTKPVAFLGRQAPGPLLRVEICLTPEDWVQERVQRGCMECGTTHATTTIPHPEKPHETIPVWWQIHIPETGEEGVKCTACHGNLHLGTPIHIERVANA